MMNIYRVDDRLIHGQVVENWLNIFEIDVIVVVNDEVADDTLRQNIMRFAVPDGIEVYFLHVNDVVCFSIDERKNYLFLFENLKDVLASVERGFKIDRLNLGGIHFSHNRNFTLGRVVFLSDEEMEILRKLISMNIVVYRQSVPQEKPFVVNEL